MLNRVILGIIFLASLAWVIYVGLDLASEKNNYSPESLFNKQDGKVLVVIRPDEANFNSLNEFHDSPCLEIIKALNDSIYNRGYFSEKRAHLLLVKNDNWNDNSVQSVFNKINVTITGKWNFHSWKFQRSFS